ncbi:MAG: hypothetical protein ACXU86_07305 [Archangium sp.]
MELPLPSSSARRLHYLARLETTGFVLLPGGGTGGVERYAQLPPMLVLDGGEELGVNLGAPVRLRLGGGAPGAGWVRREDWDSLSDWGQLVRGLKLGSDNAPVALWVGGLESYSLLSAHLVRRYSNGTNPDYHPAGAFLTGTLGPLYTDLQLSLGAEAFTWGRFDVDGRVAVQLFNRNLEVAVKGLAVGMGQPGAHYLGGAEVRWRLLGGRLYALGTGGTLLFPEGEGTLRPGDFASVGLGVDNAR